MGYGEDEQKLNIALLKIHIQDLHVVFVSYWHVETAIPNKDSGLSNFLIDTVINVFNFQHCLQDSRVLLYLLQMGKCNTVRGSGFNSDMQKSCLWN